MKNKNDKIIENKVALSFREYENKKVLFRLFNTKREKSKSFNIYEKAKFSSNIKDAFNNDYRKVDIEYDTTKNNRFKNAEQLARNCISLPIDPNLKLTELNKVVKVLNSF